MHCPNCDLRVETEVVRNAEWEHYQRWFDRSDVDEKTSHVGTSDGYEEVVYGIDKLGEVIEYGDGTSLEVKLRVDICANCAVPIGARTYTVIV